ncbi:unnamed protein product [Ambrosiozyma monospora]|uniref:Unnamed protein product n=1 Tax=Ambrosiozyma monospora TaxID=43982 RepID=A0ACB5TA23_AMBMO|nr:unnamed protein product [Ambrosiozyma monospora]
MATETPFEWSTNESDLNRFFEELQKISSPASSVRSSSSALTQEQIRLVAAAQQQHHNQYQQHQQQQAQSSGNQQIQSIVSMGMANPATSNSPHGSFTSYGSNCSTPGPVTGSGSTVISSNNLQLQSQAQNVGFNNGQFPQQQQQLQFSGNWVPSLQTETQNQQPPLQQPMSIPIGPNGVQGSGFLPPLPLLPQHQIQQPSQLPLPQHQSQSQPQQQQGNGVISTPFNSTDDSVSGFENGANESNKRRKTSKEGQRIYKMITQVPTEGIWEQFFGNGFADL